MTVFTASQDRDANRQIISSDEAFLSTKTVTFDGTSGNGATGTVNIFTVTGDVLASTFAICTDDLVSAGGGDIALGLTGATTVIITTTTATGIDTGESWVDAAPGVGEAPTATRIYPQGVDVIATVGTADITAGTLVFYCKWRPLSADGNVVAA